MNVVRAPPRPQFRRAADDGPRTVARLFLRLIWRSGEELVRQRVGVLLEACLKRLETLIHVLFQRARVADERTDERQNHHGHDGDEDPAHGFIGHRFGGFGCTKNPPTFMSRQGRILPIICPPCRADPGLI